MVDSDETVERMRGQKLIRSMIDMLNATGSLIQELEAHERLHLTASTLRALSELKLIVTSCEYTLEQLRTGQQ